MYSSNIKNKIAHPPTHVSIDFPPPSKAIGTGIRLSYPDIGAISIDIMYFRRIMFASMNIVAGGKAMKRAA
jgi:hypothetical protein